MNILAKKIHQFIISEEDLNKNIFENIKVYKLGIQAPSGTKFNLGGGEIIVGYTGIYELDLIQFNASISTLQFTNIPNENNIIVDIIYEGDISVGGAEV